MTVLSAEVDYEDLLEEENDSEMELLDESDIDDNTFDISEASELEILNETKISKDTSLPRGWCLVNSNMVRSPSGQNFKSKRHALMDMINSGKCTVADINMMRSSMKEEGWQESDKIPRGWMMKNGRKNHGPQLLGVGGELFLSTKKAAEFVEKFKQYFYPEDLEKMRKMCPITPTSTNSPPPGPPSQRSSNKGKDSSTSHKASPPSRPSPDSDDSWLVDGKLYPQGWKYKEYNAGNSICHKLLSPDGVKIKNRRLSLKYMIDNNYPKNEVEIMRKGLKHDGWITDPLLPHGWHFKMSRKNKGRYEYCTDDGTVFYGKEKALALLKFKSRSVNEIKNFKNFSPNGEALLEDESWMKNQPSVPSGWKIKRNRGNFGKNQPQIRLLSPDGKIFQSRRAALMFLIEEKYPDSKIEAMRKCLKYDGWLQDKELPLNWFYKSKGEHMCFINPLGHYVKTKDAALKYLDGKKELQQMKQFCKNLKAIKDKCKELDDSWIQNHPSVPSGWFAKESQNGSQKVYRILSPEKTYFATHRLAYKHMIDKRFPEDEIEEMRTCLQHDGWNCSPMLPTNWLYKPERDYSMKFIDEHGNLLRNKETAMKTLKQNGDLEHMASIANLSEELKSNRIVTPKIDDTWLSDQESVPAGWLLKTHTFGKNIATKLLSPEGKIFQGRRAALKFMIDKKFPKEQISDMRNCLIHDGWSSHEDLPHNWFYKTNGDLSFIDPSANLTSRVEALRLLKLNGNSEDLEVITAFCKSHSSSKTISVDDLDDSWQQIPSLPSGWMIQEVKFGNNNIYKLLSPEGKLCQGKRRAYKYMVDSKYPEEQIKQMRQILKEDGWKANELLPDSWLHKEQKPHGMLYLSSTGEIFKTKEAAVKYLKTNNFEDIHIENMNKLSSCARSNKSPPGPSIADNKTPPGPKSDKSDKKKDSSSKKLPQGNSTDGWVDFDGDELSGWKYKPGQQKYLSPSGDYLNGRGHLLKFMINNNFTKEQILAVKKFY